MWVALNDTLERILSGEEGVSLEHIDVEDRMDNWLFHWDPVEKGDGDVVLNGMQTVGCVLARLAYLVLDEDDRRVQDIVDLRDLCICDTAVDKMEWRALRNAIDNLQLHWGKALGMAGVSDLCWKLFSRFGYFAAYSFSELDSEIDDVHAREIVLNGEERDHRLADVVKIQVIDVFFCMFRCLWLHSRSTEVPGAGVPAGLELHRHHFEAATDTYYSEAMYDDVHIGCVLQYMHRFSGMYHSISQVAYFHNPNYSRRKAPTCVQDLLADGRTAMDWIPVLQQLYPEISIAHEDVAFGALKTDRWAWVHCPGCVFLVAPGWRVLRGANPAVLIAEYLSSVRI